MDLVLSKEDFVLLKKVMETYISDLRMEIANTDSFDWRQRMHEDEDRAKAILDRLQTPQPAEAEGGRFQILVEGFVVGLG